MAQVFLFVFFSPAKGLVPCKRAHSCALQKGTLAMMKAANKKRGGNSAPNKRMPFPTVSQEALDKALMSYTRAMGIKQAFNLYQYKNLQKEQAESPQSMAALAKLVDHLLVVSSCAKIKYKALQQSFVFLMHEWGASLLKAHWDIDEKLLAGRAADAVGVLLKHWRKVASSEAAWQKATSKLDEADTQTLWRLRKKTTFEEEKGGARRKLEVKVSEVSMDSKGFPRMTKKELTSEEASEEEEEEEEEEGSEQKVESELPGLDGGPPPCQKKDWREQAMKRPAASTTPMKKPTTSESLKKASEKENLKRPAAKNSTQGSGEASVGPAKGLGTSTGKVLIHQDTISIGGGKNQSYLQHQPGPGKNKRLIAAVTLSQASNTTKTHKQLVQMLLPACKKHKATKEDVLAERERLFSLHAK